MSTHRTVITTAGTQDSPDGHDCPSVHRLPGRDEVFVVVRDEVDDDARAQLAGEYNPERELLGGQLCWVPCGLMDLTTLGRFMDDNLGPRWHHLNPVATGSLSSWSRSAVLAHRPRPRPDQG